MKCEMCCQTTVFVCVLFFFFFCCCCLYPITNLLITNRLKTEVDKKTSANKCPWLRRTQWKTTPLATKNWPVACDPDALHLFFQLAARLHRHQPLQQTEIIRREYLPIPQRTIHLAGFKHLLITISCHNQNVQKAPPSAPPIILWIIHLVLITISCHNQNVQKVPPSAPPIILWIIHLGQRFDCHYELYL